MSATNSVTKQISEIVIAQYQDMSWEGSFSSGADAESVRNYMYQLADDCATCELPSDDDELMPSWCALVLTPAIASTIDWDAVYETLAKTLCVECYHCGEYDLEENMDTMLHDGSDEIHVCENCKEEE